MKVFVRGELIDSEKEPVFIIFNNDEDRKVHVGNMVNMAPKENSIRVYAAYPDGSMNPEKFMEIVNEIQEKAK